MEAKQWVINNQEITEEIKEEILKMPRNKWQWKHGDPETGGHSKAALRKQICSNTTLPQETRKSWNKQPNFTHRAIYKKTATATKSAQS